MKKFVGVILQKGEKMGAIIAIANQKGGVGKTTTTISLSSCLAEKGMKILAVDLDPQANMTSGFGIDKDNLENTVYQLLIGQADTQQVILENVQNNVDVVPSSLDLAGAEVELMSVVGKEFILRDALQKVQDNYDYIIIDCPPSLSTLTVNAMVAANAVLVPIQCEYYALEGLSQLIQTVELVQSRLNPDLYIAGVVLTMYDARTNLSMQVADNVRENLDQTVFDTVIPRNIRLAEAPSYGIPINVYDPRSAGAESYERLADEVMQKIKR